MSYSKLRNITCTIKASGGDSRKMHPFAIDINQVHTFGREIRVQMRLCSSVRNCVGLWYLTAVFASAIADAESDGKCHRRQGRSPRQEPDALRFKREITVFPALAQTYTKNHERPNADAGVRRVCGIYGAKRNKSRCLAAGTRSGPVWPLSEELEDLEWNRRNECDVGVAERLSSLERKKRAVLTTSAQADTLPTEGFYD
jgi:hypothetical protein